MHLGDIRENLEEGNVPEVTRLLERSLAQGVSPDEILESLMEGMAAIGVRFSNMEISVPEVLMSARAMYAALEILRPFLQESHATPCGTVAMGTIFGDIHDIGKNLVSMMLEGAGFTVIDLGIDVSVDAFLACVRKEKPDIIGMSALLSVTMQNMRDVIEALKEEGLRDSVKVIIGGAPVTQEFADDIGADAYGADAHDAVVKAKKLKGISQY